MWSYPWIIVSELSCCCAVVNKKKRVRVGVKVDSHVGRNTAKTTALALSSRPAAEYEGSGLACPQTSCTFVLTIRIG